MVAILKYEMFLQGLLPLMFKSVCNFLSFTGKGAAVFVSSLSISYVMVWASKDMIKRSSEELGILVGSSGLSLVELKAVKDLLRNTRFYSFVLGWVCLLAGKLLCRY